MSINFGNNLKKTRMNKKITQSELAEKLNTTKGTISKWENGKLEPDLDTLKKIAEVLEETIDFLLKNNDYDYDFEYNHKGTTLIHKEKYKK